MPAFSVGAAPMWRPALRTLTLTVAAATLLGLSACGGGGDAGNNPAGQLTVADWSGSPTNSPNGSYTLFTGTIARPTTTTRTITLTNAEGGITLVIAADTAQSGNIAPLTALTFTINGQTVGCAASGGATVCDTTRYRIDLASEVIELRSLTLIGTPAGGGNPVSLRVSGLLDWTAKDRGSPTVP